MLKLQKGFTLIELVMIIVTLGILAAIAIPRYMDLSSRVNTSAVRGIGWNIRGVVALARSSYIVAGNPAAVTITMDGHIVGVNAATGIPLGTAAGIGAALSDATGLAVDYTVPTSVTYRPATPGSDACQASYNGTTGIVTVTTSGC